VGNQSVVAFTFFLHFISDNSNRTWERELCRANIGNKNNTRLDNLSLLLTDYPQITPICSGPLEQRTEFDSHYFSILTSLYLLSCCILIFIFVRLICRAATLQMSPTSVLSMPMPYTGGSWNCFSCFLVVVVVHFVGYYIELATLAAQLVQFVITKIILFYFGVLLGELRYKFSWGQYLLFPVGLHPSNF